KKYPAFFTQDSPRRRPPVFQPCQAEKAVAPRGAKWPRLLPFPAAARPKKFVLTKKHFLFLPFLRFDISSLQEYNATRSGGRHAARSRAGFFGATQKRKRRYEHNRNCPHRGQLGPHCAAQRNARCLRSEEHTSELQSRFDLVCRLLLETKKTTNN